VPKKDCLIPRNASSNASDAEKITTKRRIMTEDIILSTLKKAYFKRLKLSQMKVDKKLEDELDLIEAAVFERKRQLSENEQTQNNDTNT
jgi:hypothetical protein